MNIIDDDKSFGIDVGTRDITYSGEGKIRLIQGDHNSERITFSMNRYVEQYDMSQCDKVEIHYINISSSGKERSEGVYTVADVEINPTSENEIVFSWLVSVNATRYAGSVNFLILFRNVDAEGNVTYSWSTALNKEIIIGEGMNCGDDFEEAYSDILAQWEKKVAADIKADAMADDFIIYGELGIAGPVLTLTDVSVGFSDISEAFQSGKNILMQLYYPDLNVTVRMPLVAYNDNIIVFSFVDHEAILYALTWTSENIAICHVIRLASQEYVGEHVDEAWQWKTALEERITTLETALASYKTSLNEKVEYAEWEAHEADMMNLVIDNQKSIAALEEEISGVNADLEAALEGDV